MRSSPGSLRRTVRFFVPRDVLFEIATQTQTPSSTENLRTIGTNLVTACIQCASAASHELTSTQSQIELLEAASYGKAFADDQNSLQLSDVLVESAKKVRVLNSLRNIAHMPLTSAQFDKLGPSAIARRLSNRHQHFLALKITSYLRLAKCRQKVLEHWATRKILCNPDVDDTVLCRTIRKQLLQEENKRDHAFRSRRQRRVSYATIAKTALKLNRT